MTCDIIPHLKSQIIAVCFFALVTGTYAGDDKKTDADADAVDNTFFVVFKRNGTRGGTMSIGSRLHGAKIQRKYNIFDIEAVSVQVPGADTLVMLRKNPEVDYVEPVLPVFACRLAPIFPPPRKGKCSQQKGATWNLDRIDQRTGTDGVYHYKEQNGGSQSFVYVLDTKILPTHPEFESRAVLGNNDCVYCSQHPGMEKIHSHGTHVAAVIGGKTYGVAKKVNIVGVQVLNNDGAGISDDTIEALEWVVGDCKRRAKIGRCIVNLSFSTERSSEYFNSVVDEMVRRNIPVVVSAGNDNKDACGVSPASALLAITVGSVDRNDRRSRFSNFGDCVNAFAPGEDILSAFTEGGSKKNSGTSQAAPHVTGLLALHMTELTMRTPPDTKSEERNILFSFINQHSVLGIVEDSYSFRNDMYINMYCILTVNSSKSIYIRSPSLAACYFTTIISNSVVVLTLFIRL